MNTKPILRYQSKLGDRRVVVTLVSDGSYHYEYRKKTSYRTTEVLRFRLTAEAAAATVLCMTEICKHTGRPLFCTPEMKEGAK